MTKDWLDDGVNPPVYRWGLFASQDDYFRYSGSSWMHMTRSAGVDVMLAAASHGLIVLGYEAGIWHNPGFEARLDGIASSQDAYAQSRDRLVLNNLRMARVLEKEEPPEYDVVVVSTAPYPFPLPEDPERRARAFQPTAADLAKVKEYLGLS